MNGTGRVKKVGFSFYLDIGNMFEWVNVLTLTFLKHTTLTKYARYIHIKSNPVNIYLFKFNNRNTRKRCEICSFKVNKKTPSYWCLYRLP